MREHWQPTIEANRPPNQRDLLTQLPRPLRIVSAALSAAISLALAACGPTPAPTPKPSPEQPGSSPAVATKVETPPPQGFCLWMERYILHKELILQTVLLLVSKVALTWPPKEWSIVPWELKL